MRCICPDTCWPQPKRSRLACRRSDLRARITKSMLHREWNMDIEGAIDAEAQAQAICMATGDFRRAFEAFADKRRPEFRGD